LSLSELSWIFFSLGIPTLGFFLVDDQYLGLAGVTSFAAICFHFAASA